MAQRGRKPKQTEYEKAYAQVARDLDNEKKALVRAERALAKAKKTHEELVAKVARLDMAERSLKALNEGKEPPTNVKYVYNYPQWVWGMPYTWYWNGNTYTWSYPNTITGASTQWGQTACYNSLNTNNNVTLGGFYTGETTTAATFNFSTPTTSSSTVYNTGLALPEYTVDLSTGASEDDMVETKSVAQGE